MVHDDPRKLAKPIKPDHTAKYKQGNKTALETGAHAHNKSIFNADKPVNPMIECEREEQRRKPRKAKREHRIDPFMVRQAKLKAQRDA